VTLEWDETTFQSSRVSSLQQLAAYIDGVAATQDSTRTPPLVVVDDLMYLRSMRREVYVLCRDRGAPLLVVWLKTDLEIALERNSHRMGRQRIDAATVRRIATNLQPPDPAFIFDRNNIVVDGNGTVDS
jgi:tRNA uridine 5-carbamoylmethylation protein Kti12